MSRTLRIIVVMLALLLTISIGTSITRGAQVERNPEASQVQAAGPQSWCGPLAARWQYVHNMRDWGCMTWTNSTNFRVSYQECAWTSIGVWIGNVRTINYTHTVAGKRVVTIGCIYEKGLPFFLTGAVTCWVKADIRWSTAGRMPVIGKSYENWC